MNKASILRQIQSRMPDDILFQDETDFEFTEDEFVVILSWLKYFNHHYSRVGKTTWPDVHYPIISKRLRLDFSHYFIPEDNKYIIYLSENSKESRLKGSKVTVQQIIRNFQL